MHKKTRKILFSAATVLFVLISILAVLFSLGYKYDFIDNKLVKTGSFRVATNLSGAEVYINSRLAGKTSALTNNFSRGRLLPRTYEVRIEKTGHLPWEKNIAVQEAIFSDFPAIVMPKEHYSFEVISSSSYPVPAVSTFDTAGERIYVRSEGAGGAKNIGAFNFKSEQLPDAYRDWPSAIFKQVAYIHKGGVYFLSRGGLSFFNPEDKNTSVLIRQVSSFHINNDKIFFTKTGASALRSSALDGSSQNELFEMPAGMAKIKTAVEVNGSQYFLFTDSKGVGHLFVFRDKTLSPVKENVLGFMVSPDKKKLAYFNKNEVWVRWIDNTSSQPVRKAGDEELITRLSEKINNINWYKDSEHIFVHAGLILRFLELDGRGGSRNIYNIFSMSGPFLYDGGRNNLWFFDENKLMRIKL